jgi:hypothetical protein
VTPEDWGEVFNSGINAAAGCHLDAAPSHVFTRVLFAMEQKCNEIGRRQPRSDAIKIIPPTIIEGGQPHGKP